MAEIQSSLTRLLRRNRTKIMITSGVGSLDNDDAVEFLGTGGAGIVEGHGVAGGGEDAAEGEPRWRRQIGGVVDAVTGFGRGGPGETQGAGRNKGGAERRRGNDADA